MKLQNLLGISIALLIFVIGFNLYSKAFNNKPFIQVSILEGKVAPDFKLKNLDGKLIQLSSLKGKVIILDFWATWCGPCRKEIPSFIELQKKYGKKGLVIIGISLDEDKSKVVKFVKDYKINYKVLSGDQDVCLMYGGIESIPTTFVIGKDLKIKKEYVGTHEKEVFEEDIKKLF